MEHLLIAMGSCMGIDVVDILGKGRQDLRGCEIRLTGERREEPPRRFTRVGLEFRLTGRGLSRAKAERAVELSLQTYCSVSNTLDPDLEVTTEIVIEEDSG